ncbi:MAG TPA: hypothetical protein VMT81_02885 [Candidatus Paceibacterota bacterium]|nr:hypothetical protein [Candidatus Paceibacterota bacterium]
MFRYSLHDFSEFCVHVCRTGIETEAKLIIYIGDVENDFIAARAAGMKFLLYSKTSLPGVEVQTSDFRAIPVLLKDL